MFVLNEQLHPNFSWLLYIPRELKMLVCSGWKSTVEVKGPERLLGWLGLVHLLQCPQVGPPWVQVGGKLVARGWGGCVALGARLALLLSTLLLPPPSEMKFFLPG